MYKRISDYYEANLSALKKFQPQAYEIMAATPSDPVGELTPAGHGNYNLRIYTSNGEPVFLHQEGDVKAEVEQFLKMIPEESTGFVALLGMGLGYAPLAILEQRPNIRHLAVFELNRGIFRHAMEIMDLTGMIADRRLLLSVGSDPDVGQILSPAARALQLEALHTIRHLRSFMIDPEGYNRLNDDVFASLNEFNMGGATVIAFGKDFITNRFRHLTSIQHHRLLENLKDAFSGIPAILVAGGPSLDKNIRFLSQAKERAVIIAVDTVLPALLSHGITPDFVTSIDPEEFTYEKFADVIPQVRDISMICTAWVTPRVSKLFPARHHIWAFSGNPIETWLTRHLGGTMLTGGAKTVAHLNLVAASVMGCSPIIFVGQDLAFTDNKDHATHTVLSNQAAIDKVLKSKDVVWVDGIEKGTKVPTNRSFHSMIMQFERMIESTPAQFFNATEGGANLKGAEAIRLETAIEKYCSVDIRLSDRIRNCLDQAKAIDKNNLISEFRKTIETIERTLNLINKTDMLSSKITKALNPLYKKRSVFCEFKKLSESLQRQVHSLDRYHKKLDNELELWRLLEEVTMEGLRQSERMLNRISQLEGQPEKYLDWLKANLERLDTINAVRKDVLAFFKKELETLIAHHDKECDLIQQHQSESNVDQLNYELGKHYFESQDYELAKRFLSLLPDSMKDNATVKFYMGAIYVQQSEYEKGNLYLNTALESDPALEKRINEFRECMGNRYLEYALRFQGEDVRTYKRMLFKGIRYCGDHNELRKRARLQAYEDLQAIEIALEQNRQDGNVLLDEWLELLGNNKNLDALLKPDQKADFYRIAGNLNVAGNNPDAAENYFFKAIEVMPDRPEFYIMLADTFFSRKKFDRGIAYLDKAVALDCKYAVYWENIGDNLFRSGLPSDAALAYEKCFIVLPGNIGVLKKIGDCHMAAGRLEAANEAYQQLKKQLSHSGQLHL